jgi:Uma2 family endonuclease
MSAIPVPKLSVEEYLVMDRAAEIKSEYYDGEVFPILAASVQHGRVLTKITSRLDAKLSGSPCFLVASPIRVRVSPAKFLYPDLLVICGGAVVTDEVQDTVTNPKVIVEILSPSTADYDYGSKFAFYRRLPSFEEYVLIAQDEPRIEVFRKTADNRWILTSYEGLESTARVESLEIELPLSEIYLAVTRT